MNAEQFQAVVDEAMGHLPEWVHEAMQNIDILVVDEPEPSHDPDVEGLLGLYTGLPLTEREANYAGELPDVIYLFRLPHLALGLPEDELRDEIVRTLYHEIAHYFGLDDDRLDELGWG